MTRSAYGRPAARCAACGEGMGEWSCPECEGRTRFVHCGECHAEIAHGVLPKVTDGKPGGVPSVADRGADEGADSPWRENAVRALEDDREGTEPS